MNVAILTGNLGQDPELKSDGKGDENKAVARISVATSAWRKGEKVTDWHRVTVFGKGAIFITEYAKKGSKVSLQGEIAYDSYEGKDGNKVYTTEIHTRNIELCDSKKEDF